MKIASDLLLCALLLKKYGIDKLKQYRVMIFSRDFRRKNTVTISQLIVKAMG